MRIQRRPAATPAGAREASRKPLRPAVIAAGLAAAAGVLLLSACSAAPRSRSEESWREYGETLRRLQAAGAPLAPGSAEERRAIERFQSALGDYTAPDFPSQVRRIYAEDVFFNDTLKTLRSAEEVAQPFAATAEAVEEGRVEWQDLVSRDGDYYFRWLMTIRFKRLADGRETLSAGMTHVRFDAAGRVVLHQDFWDSAGGLFEHVPVLGWMLRRAKNRP